MFYANICRWMKMAKYYHDQQTHAMLRDLVMSGQFLH